MKAAETIFLKPYRRNAAGQLVPNLPHLKKKGSQAGTYLIKKSGSNKILYVGYSETQLYKTIYRHFQAWNDQAQERTTYDKEGYSVKIFFTTPAKAAKLEQYFIKKYEPQDNKDINVYYQI